MDSSTWKYKPLEWGLNALAFLPLQVLYVFADVLFVIIYYVAHYRRKVVESNISGSFPELSEDERKKIIRRFYRHFSDYFFETIKLHHISDSEMRRRMEFKNMELVDRLFEEGRSLVAYFSHCGNWEWGTSITLWSKLRPEEGCIFAQVYRPLKNRWFDEYFLHLRSRFNSRSLPKRSVLRDLIKLRRSSLPVITGFMSDQKPSHNDEIYALKFLNRPTAVITGTEQLARKLDMAVVYMDMEKLSRGHYRVTLRLITEHPAEMPDKSITNRYFELLETSIRRNPHIWLWTHKRWKHKVTLPTENPNNDEKTDSRNNS